MDERDLDRIRDRYFRYGGSGWLNAKETIRWNLSILRRMIIESGCRLGVRLPSGSYHASSPALNSWRSNSGKTLECSLVDLIVDHGNENLMAVFLGPEEDLEYVIVNLMQGSQAIG